MRRFIPSRERILGNPWLRWLVPFLGHPRLWHWSRRGVATGVAIGLFFGLLIPIAQIPLSAAGAILLRANVPAAAASTLVTNPVTFAPIYYAAYQLGAWVTGAESEPPAQAAKAPKARQRAGEAMDESVKDAADKTAQGFWGRLGVIGLPLLVGLAITASIAGLTSYALISIGWYWLVKYKRWRKRQRIYHT